MDALPTPRGQTTLSGSQYASIAHVLALSKKFRNDIEFGVLATAEDMKEYVSLFDQIAVDSDHPCHNMFGAIMGAAHKFNGMVYAVAVAKNDRPGLLDYCRSLSRSLNIAMRHAETIAVVGSKPTHYLIKPTPLLMQKCIDAFCEEHPDEAPKLMLRLRGNHYLEKDDEPLPRVSVDEALTTLMQRQPVNWVADAVKRFGGDVVLLDNPMVLQHPRTVPMWLGESCNVPVRSEPPKSKFKRPRLVFDSAIDDDDDDDDDDSYNNLSDVDDAQMPLEEEIKLACAELKTAPQHIIEKLINRNADDMKAIANHIGISVKALVVTHERMARRWEELQAENTSNNSTWDEVVPEPPPRSHVSNRLDELFGPVEPMVDAHGKTWPDWMSYVPAKYHDLVGVDDPRLFKIACRYVPKEHPFHNRYEQARMASISHALEINTPIKSYGSGCVALKALGEVVADIITPPKEGTRSKRLLFWRKLEGAGFEPIKRDGTVVDFSNVDQLVDRGEVDAIRCKGEPRLVLTFNSGKYNPVIPVDNREFLENLMCIGARTEDMIVKAAVKKRDDVYRQNVLQAVSSLLASTKLEEEEAARVDLERYHQSDEYKRLQRERNQKAKEKEKANKAAKKAEAERKEQERKDKEATDKLIAQMNHADECINNAIKWSQKLWSEGDRKAARDRLATANKKHSAKASDLAKTSARAKRAEWDAIELAEREAAAPPTPPSPPSPPTLDEQLAIIANDTPDVSPEPSPPESASAPRRESNSQRKARRKREKAVALVKLNGVLLGYVQRFRVKKRFEALEAQLLEDERVANQIREEREAQERRIHAERQRQAAEQQAILDEIHSRDPTERTNRAIARMDNERVARTRNAIRLTPVRTINVNGGDAGIVYTNRPPKAVAASEAGPLSAPLAADDDDTCIVCMDRLRTHSTVPCGHKKFCGECVAKLTREGVTYCPECKTFLLPEVKFIKVHA